MANGKPTPRQATSREEAVSRLENLPKSDYYTRTGFANAEQQNLAAPEYQDYIMDQMGNSDVYDMVMGASQKTGIEPQVIYGSLMEEGLGQLAKIQRAGDIDLGEEPDYFPYDAYKFFGADTIGSRYKEANRAIGENAFRPGENMQIYERLNDAKTPEPVKTARFASGRDASLANAALLKSERDKIQKYAKDKGANLSGEMLDFFGHVGFNAGAGNAREMLDKFAEGGKLEDASWLQTGQNPFQGSYDKPFFNAIRRIGTARALGDVFTKERDKTPTPIQKRQAQPILGQVEPQMRMPTALREVERVGPIDKQGNPTNPSRGLMGLFNR